MNFTLMRLYGLNIRLAGADVTEAFAETSDADVMVYRWRCFITGRAWLKFTITQHMWALLPFQISRSQENQPPAFPFC